MFQSLLSTYIVEKTFREMKYWSLQFSKMDRDASDHQHQDKDFPDYKNIIEFCQFDIESSISFPVYVPNLLDIQIRYDCWLLTAADDWVTHATDHSCNMIPKPNSIINHPTSL